MRVFLGILFWIWGLVGAAIAVSMMVMFITSGAGVGDTAVLQALLLFWNGGLLFFGFAALLAPSRRRGGAP